MTFVVDSETVDTIIERIVGTASHVSSLNNLNRVVHRYFPDREARKKDNPLFLDKERSFGHEVRFRCAKGVHKIIGTNPVQAVSPAAIPIEIKAEIEAFARGVGNAVPTNEVVAMANRIARVAIKHAPEPEIAMDEDGELSFYMRLEDGRLIMADMDKNGVIDVGVYSANNELELRLPRATENQFAEILKL